MAQLRQRELATRNSALQLGEGRFVFGMAAVEVACAGGESVHVVVAEIQEVSRSARTRQAVRPANRVRSAVVPTAGQLPRWVAWRHRRQGCTQRRCGFHDRENPAGPMSMPALYLSHQELGPASILMNKRATPPGLSSLLSAGLQELL